VEGRRRKVRRRRAVTRKQKSHPLEPDELRGGPSTSGQIPNQRSSPRHHLHHAVATVNFTTVDSTATSTPPPLGEPHHMSSSSSSWECTPTPRRRPSCRAQFVRSPPWRTQHCAGHRRPFPACEHSLHAVCLVAGSLPASAGLRAKPFTSAPSWCSPALHQASPLHQPMVVESLCALAFVPCVFEQVSPPPRVRSECRGPGFPGAHTVVICVVAGEAHALAHIPKLSALSCSTISSCGSFF
jgi:hypothetical protein